MMKQSEAVVLFFTLAVKPVAEGGAGLPSDKANKETRAFVVGKVEEGLRDGSIGWSGDRTDPATVKTYAKSVVGNHFKKQPALNGGADFKYEPLTRRGPIDKNPEIVELKQSIASLKHHGGDMSLVRRAEARIADIREAEKAAKKGVNIVPLDQALAALEAKGIRV